MSKYFVIGDIHGRQCWQVPAQQFVDENPEGTVIMLGDYVDSFVYADAQMIACLSDVILFKTRYPDNVVLLLGNHDFQYLYYPTYRCSGFRDKVAFALHCLYKDHAKLFQVA